MKKSRQRVIRGNIFKKLDKNSYHFFLEFFDDLFHELTTTWPFSFSVSRCRACPSGTYSKQISDGDGSTYICEACPAGQGRGMILGHFSVSKSHVKPNHKSSN